MYIIYIFKFENFGETEKSLGKIKQCIKKRENSSITIKEDESVVKNISLNTNSDWDGFVGGFDQTFKEDNLIFCKVFLRREEGTCPISFHDANIHMSINRSMNKTYSHVAIYDIANKNKLPRAKSNHWCYQCYTKLLVIARTRFMLRMHFLYS